MANWPLKLFEQSRVRFGKTFTIRPVGQPPMVFFSDPGDVQELLAGPADKLYPGEGVSLLLPILGDKSFTLLEEDDHLYGRKVIMPALHNTAVQQHADFVADLTEREIASWPRGVPFALHPRLRALILEMILRVIFGPTQDERLHRLRDGLLDAFSIFSSVLLPAPPLRRIPPGRSKWSRFLSQLRETDKMIYALIDERNGELGGRKDVVDLLCKANSEGPASMSRKALRDNIMTVLLAGHETTASALAWSFQLLAHNPAVLNRLTDEIDDETGNAYAKATVHEVLRYRPVFTFTIPRAVKRKVEVGGRTFVPPTYLAGSIYLIHHNPAIHPDPHIFRPERFLKAAPEAPVWVPWGGGRKRCPGLHLALMEMEIVIRTVLRSLSIQPTASKMERAKLRSVIITPHAKCRVILHNRSRTLMHLR
jgi:cytochrome P450